VSKCRKYPSSPSSHHTPDRAAGGPGEARRGELGNEQNGKRNKHGGKKRKEHYLKLSTAERRERGRELRGRGSETPSIYTKVEILLGRVG